MPAQNSLQDKVALVVGGSSESGPTVCRTLAAHGADLAISFKDQETKAAAVAAACQDLGAKTAILRCELSQVQGFPGLVADTVRLLGRLDVLVNLGGPPPVHTDFRVLAVEDFDLMMDTHFRGYFFLAREAANWMEKHGGGLIVNFSATSSLKYSHAAYGLAKACVNEMTRFLAHTYAPLVRVITLIPGLIDIPEVDPQLRRTRAEASPLKTIITPEELGQLIVMAASPGFRNVTGESIICDGGFWLLHR
jgi:3-oxoacyl-[acyl-carrier protein] reductase